MSLPDGELDCDVDLGEALSFLIYLNRPDFDVWDLNDDEDTNIADFAIVQNAFAPYASGACCAERSLPLDSLVSGDDDPGGHARRCFTATAGQWRALYLDLEMAIWAHPYHVRLYTEHWDGPSFECTQSSCHVPCMQLPQDGEYFIDIAPLIDFSYSVSLIGCGPNDDPATISANTLVQGRIDWIGESDVYEFFAEALEPYRIEWTTEAPPGHLTIRVERYADDPHYCNATCEINLFGAPEISGPVRITVAGTVPHLGDYELEVKTLD
jgi:hypothetical protein